jgi:hypothetical protein
MKTYYEVVYNYSSLKAYLQIVGSQEKRQEMEKKLRTICELLPLPQVYCSLCNSDSPNSFSKKPKIGLSVTSAIFLIFMPYNSEASEIITLETKTFNPCYSQKVFNFTVKELDFCESRKYEKRYK